MAFLAAPVAILGFQTTVGSVLMTAFSGLQAIGQIASAGAQARADERNAAAVRRTGELNAQALEAEATARRQEAEEQAEIAERDRRRRLSQQQAELAGRGIALSSGAPLDLLEESFFELTRDIQNIRRRGQVAQGEALERARIERETSGLQAGNLLAQASSTRRRGLLSAGTTVIGGLLRNRNTPTARPSSGRFVAAPSFPF